MVQKLHFVASDAPEAQTMLTKLRDRYGDQGANDADVIVALGGDGFMLQTLHGFLKRDVPIYGLNLGSVGFLMNTFRENDLPKRIEAAEPTKIRPLLMRTESPAGERTALAFNEVSLLRQTYQAAKLRILLDGKDESLAFLHINGRKSFYGQLRHVAMLLCCLGGMYRAHHARRA